MTTPFRDDRINEQGLVANVEKLNAMGLRGYFVLGTNGEYKALTIDERWKVHIRAALDASGFGAC